MNRYLCASPNWIATLPHHEAPLGDSVEFHKYQLVFTSQHKGLAS